MYYKQAFKSHRRRVIAGMGILLGLEILFLGWSAFWPAVVTWVAAVVYFWKSRPKSYRLAFLKDTHRLRRVHDLWANKVDPNKTSDECGIPLEGVRAIYTELDIAFTRWMENRK